MGILPLYYSVTSFFQAPYFRKGLSLPQLGFTDLYYGYPAVSSLTDDIYTSSKAFAPMGRNRDAASSSLFSGEIVIEESS
jgi:hypothetical protein